MLEIKKGDRILCTKNDKPNFWWEFTEGKVYIAGERSAHFNSDNRTGFIYSLNHQDIEYFMKSSNWVKLKVLPRSHPSEEFE